MSEMQMMTLALLLFIAYRVVNPANERDMAALNNFRDYLRNVTDEMDATSNRVGDTE